MLGARPGWGGPSELWGTGRGPELGTLRAEDGDLKRVLTVVQEASGAELPPGELWDPPASPLVVIRHVQGSECAAA